ncbi:hypothetical protein RF11_02366 [Thelohanellus kitauei]|uniref:Protein NO VEIN C-terminal domain-containing protein n=1 Tax=Thelohanellus kitauei TaxID=669202 RepID=A0A0C2N9B5_THEKT|nr:hypothetical protein RF11_02366 [Thelohanellus kitauei]
MEFHFCPTSLEKTQKLDTSIVNEYLKAVLGSPSPCLIREISIFLSAFEQTPKERRSTLLTTFGLECSTFYAKLNYYYDIYKIKSIHMSDSFSLDYRVDYRNEPPLDDSSNPGSVRPVIQPVSNDADNLDVSNQSSSVDVSFTRLGNSSRSSYTDQVGRWGELVINQLLQTKKTSLDIGGEICEVQWMNENEESYLPYDFILRVKDYRNSEVRVYIEVKASANPKNPQFDLSFKEIEFAQHCKGNYHVIKVSPKNNKISGELLKEDDCNIRVYKNLIRHLNKRNIRLIAVPQ